MAQRFRGMWIIIPLNLASRLEKKGYDVGEAVQGIKNLMTAMVGILKQCRSTNIVDGREAMRCEVMIMSSRNILPRTPIVQRLRLFRPG